MTNKDCWETPDDLYYYLNREFQFTLDAAANEHNFKHPNYYSEENSALDKDWSGSVWCNPPYSRTLINKFADKIIEVSENTLVDIVTLTRLDPSAKWFKKLHKEACHMHFLPKRLRFKGADSSYPFPCCLMYFNIQPKNIGAYFNYD